MSDTPTPRTDAFTHDGDSAPMAPWVYASVMKVMQTENAALQAEVERLRAKVGELSGMLSEATPLVRYFAARNQRWKSQDGVLQDPHGSHALLEKLEAMQQP